VPDRYPPSAVFFRLFEQGKGIVHLVVVGFVGCHVWCITLVFLGCLRGEWGDAVFDY